MPEAISSPPATASWTADLGRSVRLFRAFRGEQTDPDRFYRTLADDSVGQLSSYADPLGATVLDVGGGLGYFADSFHRAGATYYLIDSDPDELTGRAAATDLATGTDRAAGAAAAAGTVLASGMALPVGDDRVDICFSSNVLEHVPDPWRMADEMVRVTKPGGTVFLSYTGWWGPHGGHETAPWHLLGGHRAARRYQRRHGHAPKNRYGESLFPVTVSRGLRWARDCVKADLVAAVPRYHPRWAYGVLAVPGLREFATWNLVLVLRRR